MNLSKRYWQENGIWLFTLSGNHVRIEVSNLGCTIVSFHISAENIDRNIVLGYATAQQYLADEYYMGSLVGRYAGRIKHAAFNIDGRSYALTANEKNSTNHLHGGAEGFNKRIFSVIQESLEQTRVSVTFGYRSPHLEEGYPGNLNLLVTISVNDKDEVTLTYEAQTDSPTHINLTHHCYFNLTATANALNHRLQINANMFAVDDEDFIPTGDIKEVEGSSYDFTKACFPIKPGYNDYLIFPGAPVKSEASLSDVPSALSIRMQTTFPGVLLYTGDYLGGSFTKNQGICLEAQGYPDAPNHAGFPSTLLRPGEKYYHQTKFIVENIR